MSDMRGPSWDDYAAEYEAVREPLTGQFAARALDLLPLGFDDQACPQFQPSPPPPSWAVLQDATSLRRAIQAAGFADVTVHTETCQWDVVSPAWFARHGDLSPAADALYRSLGPEARPVVRRELERQLRERHGDGRFQLAAEAHIAIGLRH